MQKHNRSLRVIYMELAAFAVIIGVSWGDELFHFSHYFFGGDYTPNWHEALFESIIAIIVAVPTIYFTWRIVKRLHHLEEFLRICAWCRRVGTNDQWLSIEEYFNAEFKTKTSHGLCPTCAEKLKNES